jgi:endonuclease/exonuclease/phosphatase (EEP) superfamily protein YafD
VPAGAPLLVAGDFNDWGDMVQRALLTSGLLAFSGPRQRTFPARLPLVQLDYVYSRGLTPLGVEVPRGRNWWRMSDHLPLIAEFGLPE